MNHQLLFRNVPVVGQFFLTDLDDKQAAASVAVGDVLYVEHETTNPMDKMAAIVRTMGGHKIGYIQKELSPTCVLFVTGGYRVVATVVATAVGKGKNPLVNVTAEPMESA